MNDTQKHVIAGCLIDSEAFDGINLSDKHFTGPCRDIWAAMVDLKSQNIPVDPVTVSEASGFSGSEMINWCDLIYSTDNIGHYAKMVRDEHDRRELINLSQDAIIMAKEGSKPEDIRATLEKSLYDMASGSYGSAMFARDRVVNIINQMEKAFIDGGKLTGLSTGFRKLDDATCGFQNSDLIIVGARPSVGKTAYGMNIAEHISVNNQIPGLIITREMSSDALIRRMICSRAGIDIMQGMRGTFNEVGFGPLAKSSAEIKKSLLIIDDRELNIAQIRAEARRQKRKNAIKYVMVDYLQLVNAPGHESRVSEVEYVSNQLKACAKELDIPVIALAQINRDSDKEKGRPRLDQLKGSGAIEQDADVVIILHRKKEHVKEEAEAIIAKQRNGPLKIIKMQFDGSLTKFKEAY